MAPITEYIMSPSSAPRMTARRRPASDESRRSSAPHPTRRLREALPSRNTSDE